MPTVSNSPATISHRCDTETGSETHNSLLSPEEASKTHANGEERQANRLHAFHRVTSGYRDSSVATRGWNGTTRARRLRPRPQTGSGRSSRPDGARHHWDVLSRPRSAVVPPAAPVAETAPPRLCHHDETHSRSIAKRWRLLFPDLFADKMSVLCRNMRAEWRHERRNGRIIKRRPRANLKFCDVLRLRSRAGRFFVSRRERKKTTIRAVNLC